MRSREQTEARYQKRGLCVEYVSDPPGKLYPAHEHHETRIYTLAGWAGIQLEGGTWRTVEAGEEVVIPKDVMHQAEVGQDGWEYVAAWDPQQAVMYPDARHD